MSISVVIPAYKEVEFIKDSLTTVHNFLTKKNIDFEIIVVDDGSTDGTYDKVLEASKELTNINILVNDSNRGKGYSVKRGVLTARSQYILFSDADLSTPISELDKFMRYLEEGVDIVIGSRALKASKILKKQSILRRTMGKIFNMLIRKILFDGIRDTQCGFKAFRSEVAKKIFSLQRFEGFCFDVEILYIAKKLGYSIKEVPVTWINREKSKVSITRSPREMFCDLFRIKKNDKEGFYEDK